MVQPGSILITGASSGIGEALARLYAGPGVTLALCGRDAGRLETVASACRAAGAEASGTVLDVTDRAAAARWVAESDRARALDLVIANAGISAGSGGRGESDDQIRQILAVNVDGVLNTVLPAIPPMRARRRGQIALMSSLAAYRGLPGAPAYCASKATLKSLAESWRAEFAPSGIAVSVICPGFVESGMTATNDFPMPFLMPAEKAARIIRRGLMRNRARIAFPLSTFLMACMLGALPPRLIDPLLRQLPRKD